MFKMNIALAGDRKDIGTYLKKKKTDKVLYVTVYKYHCDT